MATKDSEPTSPEAPQRDASSKKRKTALTEIEVDLSLPEPPSKKARRALKKGKILPTKLASSDDEDDAQAGDDNKADGAAKGDKKKKKERSPHGVWIGNLRFTVTKAELRKWLVDNSGGSITDDAITRVHMPTTKPAAPGKTTPENRGFAYVDFATFEANVAAIALSENEMNGRKLLIKDAKSFEGRPKKLEPEPVAADGRDSSSKKATSSETSGAKAASSGSSSSKIFVGNLSFNTTEDDLHAHFEKCGKIRWIKVATFEDSGKCKGYGWVNFEEPEAAQWAVKGFVKVRETVDQLEDFMDVDQKEPANNDDAANGDATAEEDKAGDDDDNDDGDAKKSKSKKTSKEPPRVRTRKWWVNQLLGRNLKIELAEDDQTRYQKRFGKGAARRQQQQQGDNQGHGSKQNNNRRRNNNQGAEGEQQQQQQQQGGDSGEKKEKKGINYHTDVSVARLTGAAVAPQGKKTTFD
ncbi:hypothetical protein VTI74DRAFT_6188 [Chaetomium olivicolor]